MEHVLQLPIYTSIKPSTLPVIEEGLSNFHRTMALEGGDGWRQHVMGTLHHEEDHPKVM
jgi:hypothetical protein